jgi:precorrin-6A/cobalt-precorrin-6A reductase
MILLLGGTTEAKEVACCLEAAGKPYIYSTRTEVKFEGKGAYRFGALDIKGLEQFCSTHQITCIINACHPFARELHDTIAAAALHIPVIRYEREFPERVKHELVHYVKGYAEALAWIETQGYTSMLALSGVQSIPHLRSFWQKHRCRFRILDRQYSKDFASRHHFPAANLLFGLPQEKEEEISLFQKLDPDVLLTKESGLNGKLDSKIEAAIACCTPILIIAKPELPQAYELVHSQQELLNLFQHE